MVQIVSPAFADGPASLHARHLHSLEELVFSIHALELDVRVDTLCLVVFLVLVLQLEHILRFLLELVDRVVKFRDSLLDLEALLASTLLRLNQILQLLLCGSKLLLIALLLE